MSGTIHSTSSILWSLIHCSRLTDMRPDWAEEPALLWMTQPIEKSRGAPEGPLIGYFCHCQHCVCPSQWPRNIHRHCERSEAISSLRRFAAPMAGTRAERWFAMRGDNDQLASFWMPFTANRGFKANPRQIVSANGMHYQSADGRAILDGTSGLWCSNAGHCRPEISEAIAKAAATLDFAPTFQLGHPLPFELAQRLADLMPPGLDRIFFTNSGSESVDTALKIALAVQRAKGHGTRTRLIGRERGYHGTGFGGISVGGLVNNRRAFGG